MTGTSEQLEADGAYVSFSQKLLSSEAFRALFREGMGLVEETASYLDGEGREESRKLVRTSALAYATESMRLTTRLMQIASWLLIQRAANEGEMNPEAGAAGKAEGEAHDRALDGAGGNLRRTAHCGSASSWLAPSGCRSAS